MTDENISLKKIFDDTHKETIVNKVTKYLKDKIEEYQISQALFEEGKKFGKLLQKFFHHSANKYLAKNQTKLLGRTRHMTYQLSVLEFSDEIKSSEAIHTLQKLLSVFSENHNGLYKKANNNLFVIGDIRIIKNFHKHFIEGKFDGINSDDIEDDNTNEVIYDLYQTFLFGVQSSFGIDNVTNIHLSYDYSTKDPIFIYITLASPSEYAPVEKEIAALKERYSSEGKDLMETFYLISSDLASFMTTDPLTQDLPSVKLQGTLFETVLYRDFEHTHPNLNRVISLYKLTQSSAEVEFEIGDELKKIVKDSIDNHLKMYMHVLHILNIKDLFIDPEKKQIGFNRIYQ